VIVLEIIPATAGAAPPSCVAKDPARKWRIF
jgi:hypothetical protein